MNSQSAYEYINSQAIREHLKKLEYPLSPVQCAFLVWQSRRHTMQQKHAAWNDIIATLPDCPVEKRRNCTGWDSLHDMLRGYMAFEQRCMDVFHAEDSNAIYVYEHLEPSPYVVIEGGKEYRWNGSGLPFSSFQDCYSNALEYAQEENTRFCIYKRFVDVLPGKCISPPEISVEYDTSGKALAVSLKDLDFFCMTEEETDLLCNSFEGLWFDIPIPFQKWDIVYDSSNICTDGMPFVLMGTVPWYKKEHPGREGTDNLDYGDMGAYGYSCDCRRLLLEDVDCVNYLNLEYYSRTLQGPERLLCAYSQFEKGQIDCYTLLRLHRMIKAEVIAERARKTLSWLPKDVWKYYEGGEKR